MWKRLLNNRIREGSLHITFPEGHTVSFGRGVPSGEIVLHRRRALASMLLNPSLKVGECYMAGDWSPGKGGLLAVLEVLYCNLRQLEHRKGWRSRLFRLLRKLQEYNDALLSRRNVRHHYDLDAGLYRRFLDQDMQYSCAYFEQPGMSLEAAQKAKCAHIARKLMLKPGQQVLDIGCGWGGMALFLARNYGVNVVGLTLADDQYEEACRRAKEAGMEDKVQFALQDYRDHEGEYDAIVSVGMFEHVGRPQYETFFNKSRELLKDNGRMLLHSIGHTGTPVPSNAWIRKYIFPGGYIPALSEVMPAVEDSGLSLTDVEVLHGHYADTLKHWHQRFQAHRKEFVERLGEDFCRMWEFYLQCSEAGFRWYDLAVFQLQMVANEALAPRTRGYMYELPETQSKAPRRRRVSAASRSRRQQIS